MKILSAKQIQTLDRLTIDEQQINSFELMERAAVTFVDWFIDQFPDKEQRVRVLCGTGNNGGDGLAIARLLHYLKYAVEVYVIPLTSRTSQDFAINYEQLKPLDLVIHDLDEANGIPAFDYGVITIDAILGSGLNRPIDGFLEEVVEQINAECSPIVSVDVASGLFTDAPTRTPSIRPDLTFTFELPRLAFMVAENADRVGEWTYRSIGLSHRGIRQLVTRNYFLTDEDIKGVLRKRSKFAHKGNFGHSLLIVGSYGMMGAAILATRASLRSGSGLVTVHIPESGYDIMQTTVPEAIVSIDRDRYVFTLVPDLEKYNAIGVGCGISQQKTSLAAVSQLLHTAQSPLVIDADALNIIATEGWHQDIPKGSILTPHPREFKRLFGDTKDDFATLALQRQKSEELGVIIVLKGRHTSISLPDGTCYFNSTGNPGMATAGSGDVLTGMLTALLAQGYSSHEAAILGVYIHGLAGDKAAASESEISIVASDVIAHIGVAFKALGA